MARFHGNATCLMAPKRVLKSVGRVLKELLLFYIFDLVRLDTLMESAEIKHTCTLGS